MKVLGLLLLPLCLRCGELYKIPWEEAMHKGATRARASPKDIPHLRGIMIREGVGGIPNRWNQNKRSTAYGLGQFLNSTWKITGIAKTDCGTCQSEAMVIYCNKVHGGLRKALTNRRRNGHY